MKYLTERILTELFYVLSAALIVFALLEAVWPGFLLGYVNLNYFLIIWLIIGIIIAIW